LKVVPIYTQMLSMLGKNKESHYLKHTLSQRIVKTFLTTECDFVCCRNIARYMHHLYGSADESVPIWLDDVSCKGNETSLDDCQHTPYAVHNCVHDEDVSIYCYSG
jgi:hypothetical protein